MHLPRHDNTGYFLTFQFADSEAFDQIIDDAYWIDFFMWLGLYIFRVWNWEWLLLMAFREEFTIRCPYVYSYNHSKNRNMKISEDISAYFILWNWQ